MPNVNDDEYETLNFADESDYLDDTFTPDVEPEYDPCARGRCVDPEAHAEGGHDY
jgi:hypothetical protein